MIINTPAFVVGSRVGTIAPPGIVVRLLAEMPEAVDVAVAQEVGEPLAFFRQEA